MEVLFAVLATGFAIASFAFFVGSINSLKDDVFKLLFFGLTSGMWAAVFFVGGMNISEKERLQKLHVQCAYKDAIFHKGKCFAKGSEIVLDTEKK